MSQSSDAPVQYRAFQERQLATWRRLGPVFGRVHQAAAVLLMVMAWLVVGLIFDTVHSLVGGTGSVRPFGPTETAVTVTEIGECRRVGPVGGNGLGYWRECHAMVRSDDGRTVETTPRHSIVKPADRGRPVEIRVACAKKDGTCRYGRRTNPVLAFTVAVLRMVEWALTIVLLLGAAVYAVRAVVGVPRYFAVVNGSGQVRS